MGKMMEHDMVPASSSSTKTYPFEDWYNGRTWRIEQGEDFTCKVNSMRSKLQNEWNARELPMDHDDYMVHYCITKLVRVNGKAGIEFQAVKYDPDSEPGRARLNFRRNLQEQSRARKAMNS